MNFICLIDDRNGEERIINLAQVIDIEVSNYVDEETKVRKWDKNVCRITMAEYENFEARISFEALKDILSNEGLMVQYKEPQDSFSLSHPNNKQYSFEWKGGGSVEIIEHRDVYHTRVVKGGISLPKHTRDCAFEEITKYIDENPWMDRTD